jgi:DNA polymerase-3 subunit gamma/tau
MTSLALARSWRPKTFAQLIGQDHVNNALTYALLKNRLHHAYLFTGTRGVGKTSVARLLAKAISCEQGIQAQPCLHCDTCLAIEQGHYIDLIEIDGASKTRVEDTRELLDNVAYTPTIGRFKIYLIDEVHMLSTHSFNALLKTLEEPPAHVKFLLATTDVHKLPLTILSRCLQFHLKALEPDVISAHLQHILTQEKIDYEPTALDLIARAAEGSVRDALSLLDQVIIAGLGQVKASNVRASLGMSQIDYSQQILHALAEQSITTLLQLSQQIQADGGYFQHTLEALQSDLHQLGVAQALMDHRHPLSQTFSAEAIQLLYQIATKGLQELTLAPTRAIGFEMTLLRMHAFLPTKAPLLRIATPTQNEAPTQDDTPARDDTQAWDEIIPTLKLTGVALAAIENTELIAQNVDEFIVRVTSGHHSLFTAGVISKIEQALSKYTQRPIRLALKQDDTTQASPAQNRQQATASKQKAAEAALHNDPFFQSLQQTFSAELVKDSVESR